MDPSDSDKFNPALLETWAKKAATGDAAALEKLLWAYRGRLVGFARRKVGADWQGKIDPEDVLQEAYIDIFRDISNFTHRDEDSFYHWATPDHRPDVHRSGPAPAQEEARCRP